MQTFTASVELDAEAVTELHAAARFFSLPLPAFLNVCLERGIEQATTLAASADMDPESDD